MPHARIRLLGMARHAATDRDNEFILPLEEVSERYAKAGRPRTLRTLQRYCASGHLDAQKIATTLGDKYLVTPQSVARHIAQSRQAIIRARPYGSHQRPPAKDRAKHEAQHRRSNRAVWLHPATKFYPAQP
jgi:hypothetical protein